MPSAIPAHLAAVYRIDGDLDLTTCGAAENAFRADKGVEQAALEEYNRQQEILTGEDINMDGVIGGEPKQ